MIATKLVDKAEASGVDEAEVISFPNGVLGFEELRRFVLVGSERDHPCMCLQSIDDPWVGFTVVDPFLFFDDYSFKLGEADRVALGIQEGEPLITLTIIVVPEDPMELTVNLLAPVIINPRTGLGRQVILQGYPYNVRHRVFS